MHKDPVKNEYSMFEYSFLKKPGGASAYRAKEALLMKNKAASLPRIAKLLKAHKSGRNF